MNRVHNAIAAAPTQLLSVDLFDTLLLRRTRPEFVRFADVARLQHAALATASPGAERLLAARLKRTREAYAAARARPGGGEVSFDAILAALCDDFALSADWVERLRRIELDYELGQLRPNRPLAAFIAAAARDGLPTVITSDTPLRGVDLVFLIERLLPGLPLTALHASADLGQTKRDGGLFTHLCHRAGVTPAMVLHMGDHPHSDVLMPRRQGLRALHLPRSLWWRGVHGVRAQMSRRRLRRHGLIP